jgi:hypothetical protein
MPWRSNGYQPQSRSIDAESCSPTLVLTNTSIHFEIAAANRTSELIEILWRPRFGVLCKANKQRKVALSPAINNSLR